MNGRRADKAESLTSAGPIGPGDSEQTRSARRESVLALLQQTIEDVSASGRDPDIGYVVQRASGLFGLVTSRSQQVRGWIYDSVSRRDRGPRSGRVYHAVLENGLFVTTSVGSGLITKAEFERGRKLGSKSFGYVNFAAGHVHFNTSSEAIKLLNQMRSAFELPPVEADRWRS